MKIKHSGVISPIYKLLKVLELDLQLGDDAWPIRFELFQNTEIRGHFRCRIWQAEHFRIQSTFPMSARGNPKHLPSDELIFIGFDGPEMRDYDDFKAPNASAAMATVFRDFERFLEHTTLEKPKSERD